MGNSCKAYDEINYAIVFYLYMNIILCCVYNNVKPMFL